MVSLTRAATVLRSSGSRRLAREGARFSGGNIRRASVFSRSSKNWGFVGALGANWEVAKSRAGVISPFGVDMQLRINSTSWRRSREKWRDGFSSSI